MFKKTNILLLCVVLLILPACGGGKTPEDDSSASGSSAVSQGMPLDQLLDKIIADYALGDGKVFYSSSTEMGKFLTEDQISSYYGSLFDAPDFSLIAEYALFIGQNPQLPTDVGIFKLKDSKNIDVVKDFIKVRIDAVLENAKNYPSVDADSFKNVIIDHKGDTVYYIGVKNDRSAIKEEIIANLP